MTVSNSEKKQQIIEEMHKKVGISSLFFWEYALLCKKMKELGGYFAENKLGKMHINNGGEKNDIKSNTSKHNRWH